jgi:16S rRNA (cytosine1402-N4)-methyltransferase
VYIDGTIGEGGHASAILEASMPNGRLLGMDLDAQVLVAASSRLAGWPGSFTLENTNYDQMANAVMAHGFEHPDGILLDLGISSFQLEGTGRGFSFQRDEPLDMRYNTDSDFTASHIVNSYDPVELSSLIFRNGEEPKARSIAKAIAQQRPILTTGHLAKLVMKAVGGRRGKTHPATRTFQALRIAVNHELENVEAGIHEAMKILRPGGRLAIISYQSLEDRIAKHTLARESRGCICPPRTPQCICGHVATMRLVTKHSVISSKEEVSKNFRSRSARLRVAERLPYVDGAG